MKYRLQVALIAAVSTVALTQIASAADLPRKAPAAAPAAPVYTWTGCYIGGNVGGAWSRQTGDFAAVPAVEQVPGTINQNDSSVIGGVHLGCNYQFDPRFVVGVEGDWSWTGLNGSGSALNIHSDRRRRRADGRHQHVKRHQMDRITSRPAGLACYAASHDLCDRWRSLGED